MHFLSGNVCVCEAQARSLRVQFFSRLGGGGCKEEKLGAVGRDGGLCRD